MQHAPLTTITLAEYLAGEMTGQIKHEFVPGQVFAMSGVREQHNLITLNIATRLREKTRGGQCRVLVTDVKLRVEAADAFYYPDVMVCCDPADDDPYVKRSPIIVVEVLSRSTAAIDRREKLCAYRTFAAQ
jgi:Uma2 family endonuclease